LNEDGAQVELRLEPRMHRCAEVRRSGRSEHNRGGSGGQRQENATEQVRTVTLDPDLRQLPRSW
jgi:hypothetical protein